MFFSFIAAGDPSRVINHLFITDNAPGKRLQIVL